MLRKEFEMSDQDLEELLKASQPVTYIVVGGIAPRSPQENANDAWKRLGQKMGFDHMTVQPVEGKGYKYFSVESQC